MDNKINFTGFLYSKCNGMTKKGRSVGISIYKITKNDNELLEGLLRVKDTPNKIKARICGAVEVAKNQEDSVVFVAICENTPIGIISVAFKTIANEFIYNINSFATWGKDKRCFSSKRKNKILNAGKGLLVSVFTEAQKNNVSVISLTSKKQSYNFYRNEGLIASSIEKQRVNTNTRPMKYIIDEQNVLNKLKNIKMQIIDSKQEVETDKLNLDLGNSKIGVFFQIMRKYLITNFKSKP